MKRNKYKGIFNISGQNETMYTIAVSKNKAYINFIHRMSSKFNRSSLSLRQMFNSNRDNYKIILEK